MDNILKNILVKETWANDGLNSWRIYESLCLNELIANIHLHINKWIDKNPRKYWW